MGAKEAHAGPPISGNTVVCDSCTTQAQFSAAAIAWYRTFNQGVYNVSVGNPSTGVIYSMTVGQQGGIIPNVTQQASSYAKASQAKAVTGNATPNIIRASDLAALPASTGITTTNVAEDKASEPTFFTLATAYKNNALINVSSFDLNTDPSAYGSFAGAQAEMEKTCAKAWAGEAMANPNWQSTNLTVAKAWDATLKSFFGKGIMVSIVFGNGDVATYQINALDPNACLYVKGSAKNISGQSLPDATPNIGGGDSGSVNTQPIGNDMGYSLNKEVWLICSFVGGVLIGCYIQPM
jgi:hypothetical protein